MQTRISYEDHIDDCPHFPIMRTSPEFLRAITHILEHGHASNTYKFALLRAFGRYGASSRQDSTLDEDVSYDYLADRFIEFYWRLELEFRLRQDRYWEQHPAVMTAIAEARKQHFSGQDRTELSVFVHEQPGAYAQLRQDIKRTAFRYVIDAFQMIPGTGNTRPLYSRVNGLRGVRLNPGVLILLQQHAEVIERLAVGAWTSFTEPMNPGVPRLYEKIRGPELRKRKSLDVFRRAFLEHKDRDDMTCFYCNKALNRALLEIDHVIPWSFVLEDRAWNLVPSCTTCNRDKSSCFPSRDFFDALNERNESLINWTKRNTGTVIDRVTRDFREVGPEVQKHLEQLRSDCGYRGFLEWPGPGLSATT